MAATPWVKNRYPQARRSDHVDVYKSESKGQVNVPDPYNWLEQSSEETDRWVAAQGKFTADYLDSCSHRVRLEDAITEIMDYPKVRPSVYALRLVWR
jgi:prolyl oligopeptidase